MHVLKKLTPRRFSNPRSPVPNAETLTTIPFVTQHW
jgi:hypothetical protein